MSKEPWEMTRSENRTAQYESLTPKQKDNWVNRKTFLADIVKSRILDDWDTDHRQAIEQALSTGKPVPESVLADYPKLQRGAQVAQDNSAVLQSVDNRYITDTKDIIIPSTQLRS